MGSRPNFIDVGPRPSAAGRNASPSPGLPSPRSGEAPPALSPLDAFALQSRLLAQRLEAGDDQGNRMSRLPPLTIANALAQHRAGYFGSAGPSPTSQGLGLKNSPISATSEGSGASPALSRPQQRPISHYPTIQAFDDAESIRESIPTIKPVQEEDGDCHDRGILEVRSSSPERLPDREPSSTSQEPLQGRKKASTADSIRSNTSNGLAPPRSPGPFSALRGLSRSPGPPPSPGSLRQQPSIRSVRLDNGDDQGIDRKPSLGSSYGRPISPYSPIFAPPRSPSMSSEYSQQPRGSINFSRPMSRAEGPMSDGRKSFEGSVRSLNVESPTFRPSLDVLSLQESIMDNPQLPSAPWVESSTPNSLTDDESSRPGTPSGAVSYVYSKYSLPRGRALSRNSIIMQNDSTFKLEWEQPIFGGSNVTRVRSGSGTSIANSSHSLTNNDSTLLDVGQPASDRPKTARTYSVDESARSGASLRSHRSNPSLPPSSTSISSGSSSRTIVPAPPTTLKSAFNEYRPSDASPLARPPDPAQTTESPQTLTPDDHLAKGIDCHENGELLKSTYHLRLGARGGNPTAMLLYGLACRHGWGMRANQAEAVTWLRKAVDLSGLEVADDETLLPHEASGNGTHANPVIARKAHKAQLALAIYELGVSYMNGWGISQDKALALRCFEIAGGWGDGDALAEAGFCYAKGVGAKKNLKKAADFYRKAEAKGVEMAGNSW